MAFSVISLVSAREYKAESKYESLCFVHIDAFALATTGAWSLSLSYYRKLRQSVHENPSNKYPRDTPPSVPSSFSIWLWCGSLAQHHAGKLYQLTWWELWSPWEQQSKGWACSYPRIDHLRSCRTSQSQIRWQMQSQGRRNVWKIRSQNHLPRELDQQLKVLEACEPPSFPFPLLFCLLAQYNYSYKRQSDVKKRKGIRTVNAFFFLPNTSDFGEKAS